MGKFSDNTILESWQLNAAPWIKAIHNNEIQSRVDVTNQAIINTILSVKPQSVLDIGCGEGWLVRHLTSLGINALGIDAIPELIHYAKQFDVGRFKELAYDDLNRHHLYENFDLAIANFSLFGKESVEQLFATLPGLLCLNGFFVIQTLHPISACGEQEYKDGWREGSWQGFSETFRSPPPWYFRTIENWQNLFIENGFKIVQTLEPIKPNDSSATSMIIIG